MKSSQPAALDARLDSHVSRNVEQTLYQVCMCVNCVYASRVFCVLRVSESGV